ALASTAGLDIKGSVNENVLDGSVILLADLQATDLTKASGVGFRVFQGASPSPAACTEPADPDTCGQHLAGDASFSIAPGSPENALVVGSLVGGRFTGGPGNMSLTLALAPGVPPISFELIGARVEAVVAADGSSITDGKLGGA